MPALLTSASIDLKRDSAVSTILAAVAGSPIWPSTRATWSEAATSVDWDIFRELATTLKPRSTNAFTMPAPIPCEAPVTTAVFCGALMVGYLLRKGFEFGQDGGEIFRDRRMNMHGALDYRIRRLRIHDVQQDLNDFIASGPKNRSPQKVF